MKKCSICKRELPEGCFYNRKQSKDGLQSECIECNTKRRMPGRHHCPRCGLPHKARMFNKETGLCKTCVGRIKESLGILKADKFSGGYE